MPRDAVACVRHERHSHRLLSLRIVDSCRGRVITIQINFAKRLFTVCGDGIAVVSFARYSQARALWSDLRSET